MCFELKANFLVYYVPEIKIVEEEKKKKQLTHFIRTAWKGNLFKKAKFSLRVWLVRSRILYITADLFSRRKLSFLLRKYSFLLGNYYGLRLINSWVFGECIIRLQGKYYLLFFYLFLSKKPLLLHLHFIRDN